MIKMWKNININIQNIEYETGKATLIKMPNNSDYAGYKFWHPSKLIRPGRNSYAVSLGYTDDFLFRLFKNGNGKYNKKEILDEIEIDVEEFEEAFGIMDNSIQAPTIEKESYLIVREPQKIEKNIEIKEKLKNEK